MAAMNERIFGPCSIVEHYLEPDVWIQYPPQSSMLLINKDSGVTWQLNSMSIITHFTQIKKIVVSTKKLKLKLCIQDDDKKKPGIVFLFQDKQQRDGCEELLKQYRMDAFREEKKKNVQSSSSNAFTSINTGFEKKRSSDDTPKFSPSSSSSSSSTNNNLTKVTQSELKRREEMFQKHPELKKEHEELVEKKKIITNVEFWESRKKLLELKREQHLAEEPNESIIDPSFSLRDLKKDEHGYYVLNQRVYLKLYSLYPWLKQAFQDQVPKSKTREQFWREFLSYISTNAVDNVVELKGLEGSTYNSYYSNYEKTKHIKRKRRTKASVVSLVSEVGKRRSRED
jgi:hypothetical protein